MKYLAEMRGELLVGVCDVASAAAAATTAEASASASAAAALAWPFRPSLPRHLDGSADSATGATVPESIETDFVSDSGDDRGDSDSGFGSCC